MEAQKQLPKEASVRLVHNPPTMEDLLPNYRYEFQGCNVSEEAYNMYEELLEFLRTNSELALEPSLHDEYIKGFKRAIALTRLWIDSIYLKPEGHK